RQGAATLRVELPQEPALLDARPREDRVGRPARQRARDPLIAHHPAGDEGPCSDDRRAHGALAKAGSLPTPKHPEALDADLLVSFTLNARVRLRRSGRAGETRCVFGHLTACFTNEVASFRNGARSHLISPAR